MEIIGLKHIYLYLIITTTYTQQTISTSLERLHEIIYIVNSNPNNTWVAGITNATNKLDFGTSDIKQKELQSYGMTKKLLGYFNLYKSATELLEFDARTKWASNEEYSKQQCPSIRKVFNSGKCKCGWAISITSVISDRLCIASKFKIKLPLSTQNLISCCQHCCSCNGGNIQRGWEYVRHKGLVSGGSYKSRTGCQPFLLPPCQKPYECSSQNIKISECWENSCKASDKYMNSTKTQLESYEKTYVHDYYSLSRQQPSKIKKDLMENGPLQVSMHMYEDFRVYTKGIYAHQTGDFICDHGVKLIGWGIQDGYKYWLLTNSFGPLWGENGLFKIAMDGSDNSEFGYAIVGPKFQLNMAHKHFSNAILIYMMQTVFINLC